MAKVTFVNVDRPALEGVAIPARVYKSSEEAVKDVARNAAGLVEARRQEGTPCVLGLPTGSTPVGVYRELVRMHRDEGLSFNHAITFNLDEYLPIPNDDPNSFQQFMRDQFFNHVDVKENNLHIPDGTTPIAEVDRHAEEYEAAIAEAGGFDLMLLGIGRTGHIGFNEPGSAPDSRTRRVELSAETRHDAAKAFGGLDNVPTHAITMGLQTMFQAERIVLLAFGEHKAEAVRKALEEPPSSDCPASLLQRHESVAFVLDEAAASGLSRMSG
ncbi:Glucosamine-6-phosphate deaminase 1 [Planctomycetes bacterium Pan216]|uniref:Glucosamine-6-phosphate deaminase n=1 Tax=Kolteria novifilia TaxID=2527975 RepID=A0A518B6A8_9BACT|nr:Glucosamine-6-phosphate deaminase 1 [Planctomycetes bacterium Pan216]